MVDSSNSVNHDQVQVLSDLPVVGIEPETSQSFHLETLFNETPTSIAPWVTHGLYKEFSLRFSVGSWVQHETPEEGWKILLLKLCKYNNEDEGNSPNILSKKKKKKKEMKSVTWVWNLNNAVCISLLRKNFWGKTFEKGTNTSLILSAMCKL